MNKENYGEYIKNKLFEITKNQTRSKNIKLTKKSTSFSSISRHSPTCKGFSNILNDLNVRVVL